MGGGLGIFRNIHIEYVPKIQTMYGVCIIVYTYIHIAEFRMYRVHRIIAHIVRVRAQEGRLELKG